MNIVALVKSEETYIFHYDDERELQMALGRFAANPELSFTWYDAAVLSQRARRDCMTEVV